MDRIEAAARVFMPLCFADGVDPCHVAFARDLATAALAAADAVVSEDAARGAGVVPAGFKLVPIDTGPNFSDSSLPADMIEAGEDQLEACQNDLANYVSGKTIDWDFGMEAVAVYRAMLSASPPSTMLTEAEVRAKVLAEMIPKGHAYMTAPDPWSVESCSVTYKPADAISKEDKP